jgi:hypothetical protein
MIRYRLTQTAMLLSLLASLLAHAGNPCVDLYPSQAGKILNSDGGRVAAIDPVEWLEQGVYRVTVKSGGQFMIRPGKKQPIPQVGSNLEYRIFSRDANSAPLAACYCQRGTAICVEEYAYQ